MLALWQHAAAQSQRVGKGAFADAGHVFNQQMPTRQQAGHTVLHLFWFANDEAVEL